MLALSGVDRRGLAEIAVEQVVDQPPVLRARAGVRDARHDDELLVRVRQLGEEIGQVLKRSDAVPLPPQDERRHGDALRVEHRQVRRHVDIGAGRHGGIEGQHRVGECFHDRQIARPGMVAREDAAHEIAVNRRPIDRDFVRSIFTRDHPGTSDLTVVEAFADAVLALDTSVPTGTYIDMSANLPVLDPERITVPTLILRGQWDGIASFQDLSNFFAKLPNPDKQFIVMPGIAHTSTRSKNWRLVYHLLDSYFSQPAPVYTG